MDIKIGYKEIECFVNRHYGICVGLSMAYENTIELTYKHNRYMPTVILHLSVSEIGETYAVFNYSSPMLVGRVIEKVVSMLGKYLPTDIVILSPEKKEIKVDMQGMERSHILLSMLSLEDLLITDDGIEINCKIK